MSHRTSMTGLFLAFALSDSLAAAAPSAATRGLRVTPAAASASVDARARALLTDAVTRNLASASGETPHGRYSVSPSLVQLRRYVERGGDSRATTVCIVELALTDAHGVIVGITHGSATVVGGTAADAIDAAAHAASSPIPASLLAIEGRESNGTHASR